MVDRAGRFAMSYGRSMIMGMMKGTQAVWAVVVLVIAILAALVALGSLGKDTGPITTVVSSVVAPLLLAMVYGEVRAVREQTNGTTSKLVDAATRQQATPAPVSTAPATVSSTVGE